MRASDERFVVDSWVESYADSAPARSMRRSLYAARWRRLVVALLRAGEVHVLADSDDDDVILGWVCREGSTLHYLYVREDFRHAGRSRALLESEHGLVRYSHRTLDWQRHGDRILPGLVYDPARAWRHFGVLD